MLPAGIARLCTAAPLLSTVTQVFWQMRRQRRHKRSDLALDHAPPVLEFAKAALELAPVPGLSFIAETLSAIVERVKDARTNSETERAFLAKVTELDEAIKDMLHKADAAAGGSGMADLEERLKQLSSTLFGIRTGADKLEGGRGFRGSFKSFFYAKRNEATLEDMNEQMTTVLATFNFRGQVSTEIAVHNVAHAVASVGDSVTTVGFAVTDLGYAVDGVGHAVDGVGHAVTAVGYAVDGVDQSVRIVGRSISNIDNTVNTVVHTVTNVKDVVMSAEERRTIFAIPHASAGYRCVDEVKGEFLEGTRRDLFEELEQWCGPEAPAELAKPLYFLDGSAGLGKSAIAHQLCTRIAEKWNLNLGGSFFFSRGRGDLESARLLFSTLAHQLALSQPALRPLIVRAAEEHFQDGEEQQMRRTFNQLLLKPLVDSLRSNSSHPTTFVIIDGLDECKDRDLVPELLRCLLELVRKVPWLRVFISSRPEPHVLTCLLSPDASPITYHRSLNDTMEGWKDDVGLYLREIVPKLRSYGKFICDNPDALESLIARADGLFIYARIAVKFLEAFDDNPGEQFALLLASSGAGLSPLDNLYLQVLRLSFPPVDVRVSLARQSRLHELLVYIALRQLDLSVGAIALLLRIDKDNVAWMLDRLRSVLLIDPEGIVVPLHATLVEFLIDPNRCIDDLYRVDPPKGHALIASRCLAAISFDAVTDYLRVRSGEADFNPTLIEYIMFTGLWWYNHLEEAEYSQTLEAQLQETVWAQLPIIVYILPDMKRSAQCIQRFLKGSNSANRLDEEYEEFGKFFEQWWQSMSDRHKGKSDVEVPMLQDVKFGDALQHREAVERYQRVLNELQEMIARSGTEGLWYRRTRQSLYTL